MGNFPPATFLPSPTVLFSFLSPRSSQSPAMGVLSFAEGGGAQVWRSMAMVSRSSREAGGPFPASRRRRHQPASSPLELVPLVQSGIFGRRKTEHTGRFRLSSASAGALAPITCLTRNATANGDSIGNVKLKTMSSNLEEHSYSYGARRPDDEDQQYFGDCEDGLNHDLNSTSPDQLGAGLNTTAYSGRIR
ncbi:hypothetical protein ACP4OV_016774 [Aristida adscensionis]